MTGRVGTHGHRTRSRPTDPLPVLVWGDRQSGYRHVHACRDEPDIAIIECPDAVETGCREPVVRFVCPRDRATIAVLDRDGHPHRHPRTERRR
jgi:hypothetical protein